MPECKKIVFFEFCFLQFLSKNIYKSDFIIFLSDVTSLNMDTDCVCSVFSILQVLLK
jgi:hypothetical protein